MPPVHWNSVYTQFKLASASNTRAMSGLRACLLSPCPGRLCIAPLRPSLVLKYSALLSCTSLSLNHRAAFLPRVPHAGRGRGRGCALCIRAMVNVDVSPSVLLGVGLIGAGVSLWQIRQVKPEISKDYDVVISCVSLLVGGILIFQGWRLDPLLLFGQLMTTGAAVSFAIEALRLRSEQYEDEEKAQLRSAIDRNKPGGDHGAALQLPPPELGQQPWGSSAPGTSSSEAGWMPSPQQQQQQQQQWNGSYSQSTSGYYDYYQQQQQQQPDAAPSGSGYNYDGSHFSAGPVGSPSNAIELDGYQQQQPYGGSGGPYIEPDYAVPPADGGYYYTSSTAASPAEYVFPDSAPAAQGRPPGSYPAGPGGAGGSNSSSSQGAPWQYPAVGDQASGGGRGQQRQVAPGGAGGYDAEDWD